jgi:hypothetical protein
MNERIKELAKQAGIEFTYDPTETPMRAFAECWADELEKFAELIVRECVNECKQEWYDLNAESVADDDPFLDPRATGIRVGQKNGILKCISKIKQHFGVNE